MELENAVQELKDEVRSFQEESVKPIQERLASLEERETNPADEKVQDLEKRLCEAESRSTEILEEIRMTQVNGGLIPAEEKKAATPFNGEILPNVDQMRSGFAEKRVLDTDLFNSNTPNDAGKLSKDTADAFIDYLIEEQTTLSRCDVRRMAGPRSTIDRLNFATEKIRLATQSTAQAVSDSVTIVRRELDTTEVIWTEDISMSFLEDNIARGNVESVIAGKLAQGFGNDMNSLGWRGDTAEASNTFLGINDGWNHLMEADSDVIDVDLSGNSSGDAIAKRNFNAVLRALPNKFRTISDLAFFCAPGFAQTYADEYADRNTNAGDATLVGGFPNLRYFGIPIIPEAAMVTKSGDTGAAALGSKLCLTPISNLVFGIQRDLTVDAEWNPRRRVVEYTMSARIDYNYSFGGVVVLGNAIAAGAL